MSGLKNFFNLKDRTNFDIDVMNNPDDAQYFFGRIKADAEDQKPLNEAILELINNSKIEGVVPKIYIWGQWGNGKTHMLYHTRYSLLKRGDNNFFIGIFGLELRPKTSYQYLHQKVLDSISIDKVKSLFDDFFNRKAGDDKAIQDFFQNKNFENAARTLSIGTPASQNKIFAWKWLCGQKLSPQDLNSIGCTNDISEVEMMVRILIKIGKLMKNKNETLLFLIDEGEKLNDVKDLGAQDSFRYAFKCLSDKENNTVGFIISFWGTTLDDIPGFVIGEEIQRRLGKTNIKHLPYLNEIENIKDFLKDLFTAFIDKEKAKDIIKKEKLDTTINIYPLTEEALDLICQFATENPEKSTPSNIIMCINRCAVEAYNQNKKLIDGDIVNIIAPVVFG